LRINSKTSRTNCINHQEYTFVVIESKNVIYETEKNIYGWEQNPKANTKHHLRGSVKREIQQKQNVSLCESRKTGEKDQN